MKISGEISIKDLVSEIENSNMGIVAKEKLFEVINIICSATLERMKNI